MVWPETGTSYREQYTQEKRATRESKWPKSREETPKEGSNNARRYRTATICSRNALKASIFKEFAMLCGHDRLAALRIQEIENLPL
jgi:hypothetical protein